MATKKVVIISDLHSGHVVGLTPPEWQLKPVKHDRKHNKHIYIQQALWREYVKMVRKIGRVDVLIVNGDCIEGKGEKSGGTELITTDRSKQCEIAIGCINRINADKIFMTYGTPYHTGATEDWEDKIHDDLHAEKIGSHEWISVNGCIFDCKHNIGSSSIPHGIATPLLRDRVWNALWALRDEQPHGDIIVRSHVHIYCRIDTADYEALSTPALQGMGSKFGSRKCSRTVDFGIVWWMVKSKNERDYYREIVKIPEQRAKVTRA